MYAKLTLVGNLGRDPEMRYMPDGTAVTNLNVATNRRWTDAHGQPAEETTWFRVSVWNKQAEACNQYLRKGSKVLVEGRLRPDPQTGSPRIWTSQNGNVGASYEVTADRIVFLTSRAETADAGNDAPDQEEDDIPF